MGVAGGVRASRLARFQRLLRAGEPILQPRNRSLLGVAITVRKEYRPLIDVIHHLPEILKGLQVLQEIRHRYGWAFLNLLRYRGKSPGGS
jgi:hypothetical protein